MDDAEKMSGAVRPRVALITHDNPLSISLTEKFLDNSLAVDVYTERADELKSNFKISTGPFHFYKPSNIQEKPVDYVVSITVNDLGSSFDKDFLLKGKDLIISSARLAKKFSAKCLFVFPFTCDKETLVILSSWLKELLGDNKLFAGVVYLGELMSSEEGLIGNNGLAKILQSFLQENPAPLNLDDRYFYPIYTNDAAKEILRLLFSLKAYATETAVISSPLKIQDLLKYLTRLKPNVKIINSAEGAKMKTARASDFIYKSFDYQGFVLNLIRERVKEDRSASAKTPVENEELRPKGKVQSKDSVGSLTRALLEKSAAFLRKQSYLKKISLRLKKTTTAQHRRFFLPLVAAVIVFFMAPWLLVAFSLLSLGLAKEGYEKGNVVVVDTALDVTLSASTTAVKWSQRLSALPVVGAEYKKTEGASYLLVKTSQMERRGMSLLKEALELSGQVFDESSDYDPSIYAEKIYLDLDAFYSELGFLEGDLDESQGFIGGLVKKTIGVTNIQETRQKIISLRNISKELPEILGKGNPKTYLIVFQDNSILRATGGSIEAFGLLTFSNGKLVESEVYESSFADQKLKGYVEPPGPLKKYFGQDIWYLKDSNWDPDFTVSATKAEWFIDKELDRSFDGVIGVDLEFLGTWVGKTETSTLRSLITGESSQNLYKRALEERGRGTEGKFLSETAKGFLLEVSKMDSKDRAVLLKEVIKGFEERHVQIFLHNTSAQRALSDLRWDGQIYQAGCSDNCYSDFLGIIESSTADSFPGDLIKKEADLSVSIEQGLVKRKLILYLDNSQDKEAGEYRSYVRVLVPGDSGFGPAEVLGGPVAATIYPEVNGIRGHKEAGVFIELLPGETKAIVFSWESGTIAKFEEKGQYLFYLRKQGGVLDYPVEVRFSFPERIAVAGIPNLSLTETGEVGYNTLLSRDFVSRIFW